MVRARRAAAGSVRGCAAGGGRQRRRRGPGFRVWVADALPRAAAAAAPPPQVNVPKAKKTYCKKCGKHAAHKVTQYKTGKASLFAQGACSRRPRRRTPLAPQPMRGADASSRLAAGAAVASRASCAEAATLPRHALQTQTLAPEADARVSLQASAATTLSSPATVARPSPSSTRRRARDIPPPQRLHSLCASARALAALRANAC
jgi:hypothetical protein